MIYLLYNPSVFCFAKSTSIYTREAEEVLTEGEKKGKNTAKKQFFSPSVSFHSTAPSSEGANFDNNLVYLCILNLMQQPKIFTLILTVCLLLIICDNKLFYRCSQACHRLYFRWYDNLCSLAVCCLAKCL